MKSTPSRVTKSTTKAGRLADSLSALWRLAAAGATSAIEPFEQRVRSIIGEANRRPARRAYRQFQAQALEPRHVFDGNPVLYINIYNDGMGPDGILNDTMNTMRDNRPLDADGFIELKLSAGLGPRPTSVNLATGDGFRLWVYNPDGSKHYVNGTVPISNWTSNDQVTVFLDVAAQDVPGTKYVTVTLLPGDGYDLLSEPDYVFGKDTVSHGSIVTDPIRNVTTTCDCDCGCDNRTTASADPASGEGRIRSSLGPTDGLVRLLTGLNPHPIVRDYETVPLGGSGGTQVPDRIDVYAELLDAFGSPVLDANNNPITTPTLYYSTTGLSGGEQVEYAAQFDATDAPTGRYQYNFKFTYHYGGTTTTATSSLYGLNIVNNKDSAFGNRVYFDGLDRIVTEGAYTLYVRGDGTSSYGFNSLFVPVDGDPEGLMLTGSGTFRTHDGEVRTFDSQGRITQRTYPDGHKITYAYANGQIDTITDSLGPITKFFYDSANKLARIDEYGSPSDTARSTYYSIDADNLLQSITSPDPDGAGVGAPPKVVTFTYDWNSSTQTGTKLPLSFTDPSGTTTFHYNAFRQITQIDNPDGSHTSQIPTGRRGLFDGVTVGTIANPAALLSIEDSLQQNPGIATDELGRTVAYTTNMYGQITTQTVAGLGTTTYLRDLKGRLLRVTEPDPDGSGPQLAPVTDFDYDNNNNLIRQTLPNGSVRKWTYDDTTYNEVASYTDEFGRTTEYTLQSHRFVTQVRQYANGSTPSSGDLITTYVVTPLPTTATDLPGGLVTKITDPGGLETLYEYYTDADRRGKLKKVTNPDNTFVLYDYDDGGNLASETDEFGHTKTYAYDNLNRLVSETDPAAYPGAADPTTTYVYDHAIFLKSITGPDPDGAGPHQAKVTSFQYLDHDRHVIQTITEGDPNAPGVNKIITEFFYDSVGNLIKEIDPLDNETVYHYDAYGRLDTVTLPNPQGNVALPNPVIAYTYDNLGRVVSVTDPSPGAGSAPTASGPQSKTLTTAIATYSVPLGDLFSDSVDSAGNLRFEVIANASGLQTNPALFRLLYIDPVSKELIVDFVDGATGSGDVTIRATNSHGLTATTTYHFDRTDATTTERLANTTTAGDQKNSVVKFLSNGNYVVVWEGNGTQTSNSDADGIFFQLYGADDQPIGGETLVNQTTSGVQSAPSVTADAAGGFAIAWNDASNSSASRVVFRRYNDDGTANGNEILVNQNNDTTPAAPKIAFASGGDLEYYIVAWQGNVSNAQGASGTASDTAGVFAKAFHTNGTTYGDLLLVNTTTTGTQAQPTIANTDDGGFSIAWRTAGTGASSGIFMQHFVAPSQRGGGEVRINGDFTDTLESSYAVMSDGALAVVWQIGTPPFSTIRGRTYAVDGTPTSSEFAIDALFVGPPAITNTDDGFAVAYRNSSQGIVVRRYKANGTLYDAGTVVSNPAYGVPNTADISGAPDGRLLVTWAGSGQFDSTGSGVYLRLLLPHNLPLPGGTPYVALAQPGQTVIGSVDQVLVTINQSLPAPSLSAIQANMSVKRFDGASETNIPITGVVQLSATQYAIQFASQTTVGEYRVRILPTFISGGLDQNRNGTQGESGDGFNGVFRIAAGAATSAPTTSYEYDSLGRITKRTDPSGLVTNYAYTAGVNPLVTVTQVDPDGAGPLTDLTTAYHYDAFDRLTQIDLPGAGSPNQQYFYDKNGNLLKELDPSGNATEYRYDNRNRLVRVYEANPTTGVATDDESPLGPETQYLYSQVDVGSVGSPFYVQQVAVVDPRGATTLYEYDAQGRVHKVTAANPATGAQGDATTVYDYDVVGNLTKVTQPNPKKPADPGYNASEIPITEYDYDVLGNQITMIQPPDAPGNDRPEFHYTYDNAGNLKSVSDPLGRVTDYDYDNLGNLKRVQRPVMDDPLFGTYRPTDTYVYDALGNLLQETDSAGNKTVYTYDAASRQTSVVDAIGGVKAFGYDKLGQVVAQTDQLGRTTTYEHDAWGNVSKQTQPIPQGFTAGDAPVTTWTYNATGNLLSVTDPRGNATTYNYDHLNRVTSVVQPIPLSGGSVHPTTAYAYNDAGDLTQETDPEGRVTKYGYDYLGRQTSKTLPDPTLLGGNNGPVTQYQYDRLDRLVKRIDADPDGAGSLHSPETSYGYDMLGRLTSQIDPGSGGPAGVDSPSYAYGYDLAGQLIVAARPDGATGYLYDAQGRLFIATRDGGTTVQAYLYDQAGNLFLQKDENDRFSVTLHDPLNRVQVEIDSRQSLASYQYDAVGNRTTITDTLGNETDFQYDNLNRLIRDTDPLGKARAFGYDKSGNLTSETDRLGRSRTFVYDNLNRQTAENWLNGSSQTIRTISWDYDLSGRMTSASDASTATYGYQYDPAGQLDVVTQNLVGIGSAITFDQEHDQLGRRKSLSASIGSTADFVNSYAYDGLSRLTQVTQAGQTGGNTVAPKRVDLTYQTDGQFDTITRYRALAGGSSNLVETSTYDYDALHRLTEISNSINGSGSVFNSTWEWNHDPADQVTDFTSTSGGVGTTMAFGYDASGQLISSLTTVTGVGSPTVTANNQYVHDLNGNRQNPGDVAASADRITETATNTYTYDDEGNRTSSTVKASGVYTVYEWDYRNRLTTVTVYNHQAASGQQILKKVEYSYDAFDMRVSRTVTPYTSGVAGTPTTERYVYDLDNGTGIPNTVFDFYDDDGPSGPHAATLRTRYLDGPVVDQVLAQEDVNTVGDDAVLWLLQDNQQSTRDIINNAGALKNRFEYDPFGQITSVTGGLGTRYLYTGQEYDPETGLFYYNARWYDPATQTFISRDPLGFAAGDTNLYRYVGNAPTNFVDPTGKSIVLPVPGGDGRDQDDPGSSMVPPSHEPDWPMPDHTGRIHDDLPDCVPTNWGTDTVQDAIKDAEKSIEQRIKDIQDHRGGDAGHNRRLEEEKRWLEKLQERLRQLERPACAVVGAAIAGTVIYIIYTYWWVAPVVVAF